MTISITAIIVGFLASIRLAAMFLVVPPFGGRFLPARMRIFFGFAIILLVLPNLEYPTLESINIWHLILLGFGEALIGVFMGIGVRALFAVTEVAGELISRSIGLMMAQQFNPESGANSNVVGVILFYFATLLFFIIGGHHQVLFALVESFQIVGISKPGFIDMDPARMLQLLSEIFRLSISIAAPFIAVDFIITLGFGVLGKVAPKINVMLISFSFRIVGGLIIFLVTANLIFNFLLHYTEVIPQKMLDFLPQ